MKNTNKYVVGYWHYGVILTYLSALSAVTGICITAVLKTPEWGILCLMISGVCDAFDGKVAKHRKERSYGDITFGIMIDSMSDLLAFGVLPVCIGLSMGMKTWYYIALFCIFVMCAVVRLSYYNVTEIEMIDSNDDGQSHRTAYEGMPVTSISVGLPVFYLIATIFRHSYVTLPIMAVCYIVAAVLFVIKFRMPKPRKKGIALIFSLMFTLLVGLFLVRYFVMNIHTLHYIKNHLIPPKTAAKPAAKSF